MPPVDVAYYYPAPYWGPGESTWAKSLLLFFDRIAILLPDYMVGRHVVADPTLVIPLEERGLLEVLEPGEWVDTQVATELEAAVTAMLNGGVFDGLRPVSPANFHELSWTRLGYGADVELAQGLAEALRAKGLATTSADGVSVPLHPDVRSTILVLLAQLARAAGERRGMAVHPATADGQYVGDLLTMLQRTRMPSAGHVVTSDLEAVGLDLSSVPLDDVLGFRDDRRDAHRAYMRSLRGFLVELAQVPDGPERERLTVERRQELDDAAHDLRRHARRAFAKNVGTVALGIVGAAWPLLTRTAFGALIGVGSLGTGLMPVPGPTASAYSFVFEAARRF